MIVSTKGRYALRVMIDLAERRTDRYTPLKEIAARQGISEKYLENILKTLVQHGLLQGLRGKGGGYRLTRPAGQYRISDILLLTEGSLAPVACLEPGAAACARAADCPTTRRVRGRAEASRSYLDRVTLADLARPDQAGDSYVI